VAKLKKMRLAKAAKIVSDGYMETISYYSFPEEHRVKIRTNNGFERIMKEIRRRTRVVGSFPDGLLGADAGRGEAETHRRDEVGRAALPGHDETQGQEAGANGVTANGNVNGSRTG